jgi:hypothetical protein
MYIVMQSIVNGNHYPLGIAEGKHYRKSESRKRERKRCPSHLRIVKHGESRNGRLPLKQCAPNHLGLGTNTSRVLNGAVLKSVELAGGADGISTHVVKAQPISDFESLGKVYGGTNAVDRVAGGAPDAALLELVLGDGRRSNVAAKG